MAAVDAVARVRDDARVDSAAKVMYLHVGAPKTGTTYLQSVLWKNKVVLREQGVTLPGRGVSDHVHAALDLRDLHDEKEYSAGSRGGLERFARMLSRVSTPKALFSQELLAPAMPEQIDRFLAMLDRFEVHVIITARDLARQVPSGWQQRVKRRVGTSYDRYLRLVMDDQDLAYHFWRSQDIAEVARRWGKPLSPDRVHIVTVPPSGSPPGLLLERFCSVIGVDADRLDTEVAKDNSSLSAPQAELMRRVNIALGQRLQHRQAGYNRLGKKYFAKEVLAAQIGPPLKLPARYAERCVELSRRMIDEIRAEGYDVVGDLADLEPTVFGDPTGPAGELDADDANDATVAEAGVQAIATLLDQRYQDLTLIRELRSELAARDNTWSRRQRRRVGTVRRNPSVVLDKVSKGISKTARRRRSAARRREQAEA